MKYVLATANPGKVAEMREILSDCGCSVITRDELGIDIDVEETGSTFLENATLKAVAICKASGMPAIADDSGICVDSLGGQPGVYSSSYGGDTISDKERYMYLLDKMKDIRQRNAKFVSTIVCAFPDGDIISAAGECCGSIALKPQGEGGFGYDPVFMPDGFDKTIGEMTAQEKNAISHRGKALREFVNVLEEYNNTMLRKGNMQ